MKIATRLSMICIVASLAPLIIVGAAGLYLIKQFGQQAVQNSLDVTLSSEKLRLQQLAEDKARSVNQFLNAFFQDVELLRKQTEQFIAQYPNSSNFHLSSLYPDKERGGLPGYGYIHPTNGAYANWDKRGYPGSVWMRSEIVRKTKQDETFRKRVNAMLNKTMLAAPLLASIYEKDTNACELMWIVCNLGFASTYPNDYGHRLQVNPEFNSLDENQEDYVKLFDATHNPKRETRWMDPYLDAIKRTFMVSCVAPFYDGDQFCGTLGMDVIMKGWVHMLNQSPVGRQGYSFLISSNSIPLFVPKRGIPDLTTNVVQQKALYELLKDTDEQTWQTEMLESMKVPLNKFAPAPMANILARMNQQRKGVETISMQDGAQSIVAFHPVGHAGWSIAVVLPMAEAQASIDSARQQIIEWSKGYRLSLIVSLSIVGLIAGSLGAWGGIRFATPLNQMINAILRVSQGGAWREIEAKTQDELQVLAESANIMVRKITEGEKLLAAIFNGVNEAIFLHDSASGRILRVNKKMCEMYHCTEQEALNKTIESFSSGAPPYTQDAALRNLSKAMAGESPVFEWLSKDLAGRLFWTEVCLNSAEVGGEMRILATVRDISERKRAEIQVYRLQSLLNNIINSMPSILVAVDAECKVTQWNQEAERKSGLGLAQALGIPLDQAYPALAGCLTRVRDAIDKHQIQSVSKFNVKTGLETRYYDIMVYPLMTNGVQGAVIRLDDITDRLRMEELLVQSEKMISVGSLAAGVAHEINNPLAGMIQNAQVLRNRLLGELSGNKKAAQECGLTLDALRAYVEKREIPVMMTAIVESGRRAAHIVQNMLSFSRKSESAKDLHNLPDLVDKAIELACSDYDLKKQYDFRQISILKNIAPDLPAVPCDASQIQQVILNLLNNGAQAMFAMRQQTPQFIINLSHLNASAVIEIQDNGPGIEEPVKKRIFEPFFTTKDVGAGTGLGLSVSYFIITQNHGGSINVESEPGKGARFIIKLPIKRETL